MKSLRTPVRAILGCLLVGAALLASFCGCKRNATPLTNGQSYTGHGFTVAFPQGWTVTEAPAPTTPAVPASTTPAAPASATETPAPAATGLVPAVTAAGAGSQIIVETETLGYEVPLDEYAPSCLERLARAGNGFKTVERPVDFTGPLGGKRFTYACVKDGANMQACAYVFLKGGTAVVLTGYATPDALKKQQQVFEQVAASFAWK